MRLENVTITGKEKRKEEVIKEAEEVRLPEAKRPTFGAKREEGAGAKSSAVYLGTALGSNNGDRAADVI